MLVLGLDPGTTRSAVCLFDGIRIIAKSIDQNEKILELLISMQLDQKPILVIEKITSYGLAIGQSTFETVYWSGRFAQAYPGRVERITRGEVKMHLCGSMRAKDPHVRAALLDRLGPPGTREKPGVTYKVRKDEWSALAICCTWIDQEQLRLNRLTESTQSDTLKASVS